MMLRSLANPLSDWVALRSRREQGLLLAALGLGLVWLLVTLVWLPLRTERQALADRIGWQDRALAALATLPGRALPGPADPRPVATVLTESAEAYQLAIRRLDPVDQGADATLDEVGFDALILWLDALEAEHALHLTALEIARRPVPGQVSVRLSVRRLQP